METLLTLGKKEEKSNGETENYTICTNGKLQPLK